MAQMDIDSPMAADPTQRRFRGCAKLADYEVTTKLGEGTFGVVSKGRSKRTGAVVALKMILMHNEKDGFPITALREIKLLKMLSHPNVLKLDEMAVERKKGDLKKRATLYMVTPYMDHDLSGMTTNPDIHFTLPQIKCYMMQLLEGLRYLHDSNILHRDMKAANILISNKGQLQIADFGLARHYDGQVPKSGLGNGQATRDYTTLVVTRWYRPPELLLQLRRYTPAIDMWGAGCVFAEMFECRPILEGKSDLNQAELIFEMLGSPTEDNMPGWNELPGCEGVRQWGHHRGNITSRFKHLGPEGVDLLQQLLKLDWRKRINAIDAINHDYFTTKPLPARPEDLPKFEESHELDRRKHHEKRAALPPAPAGGTVGMGPEDQFTGSGPPNGSYSSGNGYNERARYPPHPRDRGPPGGALPHGRLHQDNRSGPPPPSRDREEPGNRRPAWQRGPESRPPPPPPTNGIRHELPHRPDTGGPPPSRGPAPARVNNSNRDTYIPNYADGAPPPRHRDDGGPAFDGRRRGSRDHGYRDRDRAPNDRDRLDRDRDFRRTRSRSPDRERERERRERLQDRERDLYRR